MRAGFIGLGRMGAPMAGHLHARGLLAAVGNRSAAKATQFAEANRACCAATSRRRFRRLRRGGAVRVRRCRRDAERATRSPACCAPGSVVIDHSTVAAGTAREAHAALARNAASASSTRRCPAASKARATASCRSWSAARPNDLERARPVLEAYALRITHMGAAGAGQATKAVNQVLVAGIAQAVCEGLALGEKLGLDAGAAGADAGGRRGRQLVPGQARRDHARRQLHARLQVGAAAQGPARSCARWRARPASAPR